MLTVLLSPLNAERAVELALRICPEPQRHTASQKVAWQSAMIGSLSCKRHATAGRGSEGVDQADEQQKGLGDLA